MENNDMAWYISLGARELWYWKKASIFHLCCTTKFMRPAVHTYVTGARVGWLVGWYTRCPGCGRSRRGCLRTAPPHPTSSSPFLSSCSHPYPHPVFCFLLSIVLILILLFHPTHILLFPPHPSLPLFLRIYLHFPSFLFDVSSSPPPPSSIIPFFLTPPYIQ